MATLKLFAITLPMVTGCLSKLRRQCPAEADPRRDFFDQLRFLAQKVYFPDGVGPLEATLGRRRLVAVST